MVEPATGGASNPSVLRCSCCSINKSAFLSQALLIILNVSEFLLVFILATTSSPLPSKRKNTF